MPDFGKGFIASKSHDHTESSIIMNKNKPKFNQTGNTRFAKYAKTGDNGQEMKVEIEMKPKDFLEKQNKQKICGLDVYFPFQPYAV